MLYIVKTLGVFGVVTKVMHGYYGGDKEYGAKMKQIVATWE